MAKRKFLFEMVIVLLVSCILCAGCASSPSSGSSRSAPSIIIVNATGYTVWYVFVSPSDNDTWGSDLLDSDQILSNGESFTYQLPQPPSKTYDIRLVDSDEDSYTKWRVNLSGESVVVFTFDDLDKNDDD